MTDIHQSLASGLDKILNGAGPPKTGFVLLTFPFDELKEGKVNYVSNGLRVDVVVALKEVVARLEGQPHQTGTA